jgi:hypothetical protein
MQTYLIIKAIVMAIALTITFGLFFTRIRKLVQIMKSVEGELTFKLDHINGAYGI